VGIVVTADLMILVGVAALAITAHSFPHLSLSLAAWVLLVAATALMQFSKWWRGLRYGFRLFLVIGLIAVILDVAGWWGASPGSSYPTAAVAFGAALLGWVTARPRNEIVASSLIHCAVLVVVFILNLGSDPTLLGPSVLALLIAGIPPLLGATLVESVRTMIQQQSDRVQVQSTVSSPGLAVGMLASEELQRLDLDAEQLLVDVASSRIRLPLDQATSDQAAALATELRLHLIEGRRETWLFHAVSESAVLGPVVRLTDPDGLAALLSSEQRDGLLSGLWLLVGEAMKPGQSIRVAIGRTPQQERSQQISISIEALGVPRNQVDPGAWQAIRRVGRYTEEIRGAALGIDIRCVLERGADHQGAL
jgi:hypothetical protein